MKKTKEGKVIASLTEVKNKTGDIFALADEFGEVILTSYNKPRYKLMKLNVSALLEDADSPKTKKQNIKTQPRQLVSEEKVAEIQNIQPKLIDKTFKIVEWDRNSASELEFIDSITKPLI